MRLALPRFFRLPVWLLLVAALAVAGQTAPAQSPKPPATVSVEAYRAELEDALTRLRRMENHRPRPLEPLLKQIIKDRRVKRADGATQDVQAEELARILSNLGPPPAPGPTPVPRRRRATPAPTPTPVPTPAKASVPDASRIEVVRVRRALEARLKALDVWATPKDGVYYTSADAQAIVKQLEDTNQIRTGPSWWQLKMEEWQKAFDNWIKAIDNWFKGLFPSRPTPTVNTPNIDFSWVGYLFYGVVAALFALILFFLWRALAGRFGRRLVRRDVVLEGEDAELLLLPPQELRSRAQIYADEGNFREALRHRYLSLLLVLDSRGVWRYDTRRTNWEHIGALRREEAHRPLIAPLSDLTRRFDRVRYGGAECTQSEWEQYDADAASLENRTGGGARTQ
jgi:hypothetical protein